MAQIVNIMSFGTLNIAFRADNMAQNLDLMAFW